MEMINFDATFLLVNSIDLLGIEVYYVNISFLIENVLEVI
jgi:hypothetical protein